MSEPWNDPDFAKRVSEAFEMTPEERARRDAYLAILAEDETEAERQVKQSIEGFFYDLYARAAGLLWDGTDDSMDETEIAAKGAAYEQLRAVLDRFKPRGKRGAPHSKRLDFAVYKFLWLRERGREREFSKVLNDIAQHHNWNADQKKHFSYQVTQRLKVHAAKTGAAPVHRRVGRPKKEAPPEV